MGWDAELGGVLGDSELSQLLWGLGAEPVL